MVELRGTIWAFVLGESLCRRAVSAFLLLPPLRPSVGRPRSTRIQRSLPFTVPRKTQRRNDIPLLTGYKPNTRIARAGSMSQPENLDRCLVGFLDGVQREILIALQAPPALVPLK
jgi:hypothetical protein